jgi:hypothetical protein
MRMALAGRRHAAAFNANCRSHKVRSHVNDRLFKPFGFADVAQMLAQNYRLGRTRRSSRRLLAHYAGELTAAMAADRAAHVFIDLRYDLRWRRKDTRKQKADSAPQSKN